MTAPLYELGYLGEGGSLLVALLLGIGFGWFLEGGGLGNARKLAGQFYLTDMTVLKVMFSAIVTAMLGLFWLAWLGWLDLGRVYLLPTFTLPHLAGGVVFGLGFVMGGLCPGTSCVAASSGSLDGLALMGGMLFGIFAFNEAYPLVEGFYGSTPLGQVTLHGLLGVPYEAMVPFVVALALGAFLVAERVERRFASSPGPGSTAPGPGGAAPEGV